MSRAVVSRMSAGGGSGYPYNQEWTIDPDDNDNPTTGTETAGAYLYKWQHDNSGDEWHKEMNQPIDTLDWEANETVPFFSVAPYSTGARVIVQMFPVPVLWATDLIAQFGISQSGTIGNFDRYPLAGHGTATLEITCDGETLAMDTFNDIAVGLWTADNDLHAMLYYDGYTTDDDSTLETKLAATNPGLWSTNGFEILVQFE